MSFSHRDTSHGPMDIIGAGLVGSLAAAVFGHQGYSVSLWDRRPDPRYAHGERGRSINLAISERGLRALEDIGLRDKAVAMSVPMRGRMVHALDGTTRFAAYDPLGERCIHAIGRHDLNCMLLDAAQVSGRVDIRSDHRLTEMDVNGACMAFEEPSGQLVTKAFLGPVIAADGAGSVVRAALGGATLEPLSHDYKEILIPAPVGPGSHALAREVLHIWPRETFMLIALPNRDGSLTGTLFLPKEGPLSFKSLATPGALEALVEREFPDFPLSGRATEEQVKANPLGPLGTVRCERWSRGQVMLLGDAAHAIVPFFGQGMNAGFEDVRLLSEAMADQSDDDLGPLFERFGRDRKVDTDALADMTLDNFIEMRDRVADPEHIQLRAMEEEAERDPGRGYVSRYSLVSFTNVGYRDAKARGEENQRVLRAMLEPRLEGGGRVV